MSDKYKLVSHNGKMVPSGFTDGTLSFKETILYLKAINRTQTIFELLDEHVDSILKGSDVISPEGQTIATITNKDTRQTWTSDQFSHQLFMSVRKNPDNYEITYTNQTANSGFRPSISQSQVERHTREDKSKVSILGNGKKSFLLKVERSDGVDYFSPDGSHIKPEDVEGEDSRRKDYKPIEGFVGIDAKKFAANYDEYMSSAYKLQNLITKDPLRRTKSVFEGVRDSMEKISRLKYRPANEDSDDAIEGELSKLFIYASSKGMENVCEKIISFINATKDRGKDKDGLELEITDEDLGGKISAEALDTLLTNLRDADETDFSTFINMVSPRGYSLVHEVANVLQDSGIGELIRQIVKGETTFQGTKDERRYSDLIQKVFTSEKTGETLSNTTAISMLAASPSVNSILDGIFFLSARTPTKPVYPNSQAAVSALVEVTEHLSADQKGTILRALYGGKRGKSGKGVKKNMSPEEIHSIYDSLFTKQTGFKELTHEELDAFALAFTAAVENPDVAQTLKSAIKKTVPKKESKARDERIDRVMQYLTAAAGFNPDKVVEFEFNQGIDRAVMAVTLSLSRADLMDDSVQEAYRSMMTKQKFRKELKADEKYLPETKMFLAMTGLRLTEENGQYVLRDGRDPKGMVITPQNFLETMRSNYVPSDKKNSRAQESKSLWANILGPVIGHDKVTTSNTDAREAVLKYTQLTAPLARTIQDQLDFVPGPSSTVTIPEGLTTEAFAAQLQMSLAMESHSNIGKLKEYNRVFSSGENPPFIDDFIRLQSNVVADKVRALDEPIDEIDRKVAAGKHIGELLEVSMLMSTMLGVIDKHAGSLEEMADGAIDVLHAPGEGDITGDKLGTILSTALETSMYVPDNLSALGAVVQHDGKVYVAMKENRDTGAVDGEVMVFSKDSDGKVGIEKHQAEFKNSHKGTQTPHVNQYGPHASVEAGIATSASSVRINNTLAVNVITPTIAGADTEVHISHLNVKHLPTDTSSTEGFRHGSLEAPVRKRVPHKG